jgi:tyrosyl-tRNA synthetase
MFTELQAGTRHPRDVKMLLARHVTTVFHGEATAARAETHFVTVFQQREAPADMPRHVVSAPINIIDLLLSLGLVASKSAARRLLQQGGIRLNEVQLTDSTVDITPAAAPRVLRVGKRHFVALVSAGV